MNFLFLDTETTGLNNPRLVSLAFNIYGTSLINHGYYKPPTPIEEGATKVNGLTNEMMANEAVFATSKDKLHLQQLLDKLILVCHNINFDARVLTNEGLKVGKTICTQELSKGVYPNLARHKLQTLKDDLNLVSPFATAHSAVGDVITLKLLFKQICKDKTEEFGGDTKRMQAYILSFMKNYV